VLWEEQIICLEISYCNHMDCALNLVVSLLLRKRFARSVRSIKTIYIFLQVAASFSTETFQTHQLSINCFKMNPS